VGLVKNCAISIMNHWCCVVDLQLWGASCHLPTLADIFANCIDCTLHEVLRYVHDTVLRFSIAVVTIWHLVEIYRNIFCLLGRWRTFFPACSPARSVFFAHDPFRANSYSYVTYSRWKNLNKTAEPQSALACVAYYYAEQVQRRTSPVPFLQRSVIVILLQ